MERCINRALPGLDDDALSEIFGLGRKWVCAVFGFGSMFHVER